jgi:stalled ribosome alternative rescue factor ArfA
MKPVSFVLQPLRQRRHRELFDRDLPFRNRVERPKTDYQRRPKHANREEQW